ncbi:hypothetical protein [Burkholderia sp. SIMBA_062]
MNLVLTATAALLAATALPAASAGTGRARGINGLVDPFLRQMLA